MAIIQFENESTLIAYATKRDGDLGVRSNTPTESEKTNLQKLLSGLGISRFTVLYPRGDVIIFSETGHEGQSLLAQGVISSRHFPGSAFGLPSSDCPALVVVNVKTFEIGLLHLSWWQLYRNLTKGFFESWFKYNPDKKDLKIFIGPAICQTCFVLRGWKGRIRGWLFMLSPWRQNLKKVPNGFSLDLKGIIVKQLSLLGFQPEQINFFADCTNEHEYLSSLRREGATRTSSNLIIVKMK